MRGLFLPIVIALFCLSGCTHASTPGKSASAFSCKVKGQFIVVEFSNASTQEARNPEYFGVSRGDNFIYLNYPPAHADFTPYNAQTRSLKLNTKTQAGIEYENGVASRTLPFSKPGIYTLLFADNLETEPSNTFSLQCSVKITN